MHTGSAIWNNPRRLKWLALLSLMPAAALASAQNPSPSAIDVVVYGGTASGVITAYSAAREGLTCSCSNPADT